jgi:FkbM family methyltransferase
LQPGSLFVDVGANAGLYSIWAADLGSSVISVEPDPEVRDALRENAALNGYDFDIISTALASEKGMLRFTTGMGPWNHLVPADSAQGVEVEAHTLDDVLGDRTADGVKIDVEGAERLVLEGGYVALAEGRIRVIQFEYNHQSRTNFGESREATRDMLASFGYSFFRPDWDGQLLRVSPGSGGGRDVFAILEGRFDCAPGGGDGTWDPSLPAQLDDDTGLDAQ